MGQDSKEEPKRGLLRWDNLGIPSDVFGSYTGVPMDKFEEPIQDADDL